MTPSPHIQRDPLPLGPAYSTGIGEKSPPHTASQSSSSTGSSLKRRRGGGGGGKPSKQARHRNNKKQQQQQPKEAVVDDQSKLIKLRIPSPSSGASTLGSEPGSPRAATIDARPPSFKIGDAVEAVKFSSQDAKDWYCARVVDILEQDDCGSTLVFVHYEGWPADHADWISQTLVRPRSNNNLKYGPRGKEDDTSWKQYAAFCKEQVGLRVRQHTGLVHDRRMALHSCPCLSLTTVHPERPDRIASIFESLYHHRLLRYLRRIHAREASTTELLHAHTPAHIRNYCPSKLVDYEQDQPRAPKITSIAALLNPATTTTTPATAERPVMRGVGGAVMVQADQEHVQQQQRRFSTAAASTDASQEASIVVSPPGLCKMVCGQLGIAADTTFHPLHTSLSARVAAGALMNLAEEVINGRLKNGFAAIRPPGHHAQDDVAMGYCFFNNVAVAVSTILEKYPSKIKKILILDWDIHHGNGTQQIFYDNPNVLYVSIHRWDHGHFYPFSGAPDECGRAAGLGRNVNIAFSASKEKPKPMGDTEFIAAMHHIVVPIARQFAPDMIFVSAGYDAAEGHPENLGGYVVTPRGYSLMTKIVKDLAEELCEGRLVLSLEGGYELQPLASSATASIAQLLPSDITLPADTSLPSPPQHSFARTLHSIKPNHGAVESLRQVVLQQRQYWDLPEHYLSPNFRFQLPAEWRAIHSISTRTRREVRSNNHSSVVRGY